MPRGRCAGCGRTGRPAEVGEHTRYCPDFLALYAEHPERVFDPVTEYARWVAEQRAGERADRRGAAVTEAERRRAEQAGRWQTPPDILEGD